MATHSTILAWEILWTEESGGLQSKGCKELDITEHACTIDHMTLICLFTYNWAQPDTQIARKFKFVMRKSWKMSLWTVRVFIVMAVILISILQKCNQFWQSMGYTGHFGPHDSLSFYAYQVHTYTSSVALHLKSGARSSEEKGLSSQHVVDIRICYLSGFCLKVTICLWWTSWNCWY